MNVPPPGPSQKTSATTAPTASGNSLKAQRREARLKAALKANIARRKAQAQSRATPSDAAEVPTSNRTEQG